MNIIKFNNTEFELESYNRNTYFNGETISSSAGCGIIAANITEIDALAESTITSLQIYHDNELIYDLQNIDAHVSSVSEYLNTDRINITINIEFNI